MTKKNYYDRKTVFVTGADGFIGSHLVEELVKLGATVKALVYYNSWNYNGWLKEIDDTTLSNIEIVYGDIRDQNIIFNLIADCDFVFHLASLIAIPYSYKASQSYVETNTLGTLNVLNACLSSSKLSRLVHVSTSEVYGSAQFVPISEQHPLVGQSPYAASKIGADKLAESFNLSFGLPVATARPFNTFGPRQTARAIIPTIASQLLSGKKEIKLGAIHPKRDFNYVLDTVGGLLKIGQHDEAIGKTINIGSNSEWSIEQTAKLLMKLIGVEAEIVSDVERLRPKDSEVDRLLCDATLLKNITGWSQKFTFEEGLDKTVSWIRQNPQYFNSAKFSY